MFKGTELFQKVEASFEAGALRFLSSTEDTGRHAGSVGLQHEGRVVSTNHVSDFFLGTVLNLVLWTELLLAAGPCLLVSFHLKGACVMLFQIALPGAIPGRSKWRCLGMIVSEESSRYRANHSYHHFSG